MPAPENLQTQTPGEPLSAATTPAASAADHSPAKVVYHPKHQGGGRWIVVDSTGQRVGDFTGDKLSIVPEVERMNAGGEPLSAADEPDEEPATAVPAARIAPANLDPTTLKQSVLTPDGWLCPAPKPETN